MRAIVGEMDKTRCPGRFGSCRLCSGKRILLDSELDGGLSPSHFTHIRIAKDQDRKGAKGHTHYRDNERRRPAKREPLICEDLRGCAEGLGAGARTERVPARRDRTAIALAIALAPVTPARGRQVSRHPELKRIPFQDHNRTGARIRRRTRAFRSPSLRLSTALFLGA